MKNISFITPIYKTTSNSLNQNQKNCKFKEETNKPLLKEISSSTSNAIKNNIVPFISFKGANNLDSIEKIVSHLDKEYGIKADFSSFETAHFTLECIEDFVKLNDKNMFKGLVIENSEEESTKSFYKYSADYNNKTFIIKINNKKSIKDLEEETNDDYENCKIGAKDKKYYLYEVLGHFLNFKYNPYAFINNTKKDNFSNSAKTIAIKIGSYAKESLGRYNASYIATKMCGENLPPRAQNVYEDLVGADLNFPKEKTLPSDIGITHNFEDIEEASEYLKKYGVEAKFENTIAANLTVGAIEDFIKINNNPKMFEGLKIGTYVNQDSDVLGCVQTSFNYNNNTINSCNLKLNSSYDWNRHNKRCEYNFSTGHYASNHPKYSIYHELGHWLHFQKMPREYSKLSDKFKFGEVFINETGKVIFGKVSGYAQTTTLEYIAETIASKMCGLNFPKRTMQEFEELNKVLNLKFPN